MHPKTEAILKFLKAYKSIHDGCSPTYRQIVIACGLTSSSVVAYHLHKLVKLELIRLPDDTNGIEIVGGQWTMTDDQGGGE